MAAGETIAAVAIRAGLSVPYIANLENGRGNPTLTALSALATALGATLQVDLVEPGADEKPPVRPPASLTKFARSERFANTAKVLARKAGCTPSVQKEQLLAAMSATAAAVPASMSELDWHRVLDAIVLAACD
jgi:transcriptional regulator with XRE-family HTH domain